VESILLPIFIHVIRDLLGNNNNDIFFISIINQLYAQNLFHSKFYFMPLHVSNTCAHHQGVKTALHSLWYHHSCRWPSRAQGIPEAVYCNFDLLVMSTWCSKHVEAWNKLIVIQKFCASSWLITEINILRCTVSRTIKRKTIALLIVYFTLLR
jgi:hypothetical protein